MAGNSNSGRPPKWKEETVIEELENALKNVYSVDDVMKAVHSLVGEVAQSDAGKLWLLRRLWGDPKKAVELSSSEDTPLTINVNYATRPDDPDVSETSAGE